MFENFFKKIKYKFLSFFNFFLIDQILEKLDEIDWDGLHEYIIAQNKKWWISEEGLYKIPSPNFMREKISDLIIDAFYELQNLKNNKLDDQIVVKEGFGFVFKLYPDPLKISEVKIKIFVGPNEEFKNLK